MLESSLSVAAPRSLRWLLALLISYSVGYFLFSNRPLGRHDPSWGVVPSLTSSVLGSHDSIEELPPIPVASPFAYVFMIWGCDPTNSKFKYRPYIANMMIAAKLLKRKFGSTADLVAMIKLKYDTNLTRLPPQDEAWLHQFGIRLLYLPRTPDQAIGGGPHDMMMHKFDVWNLTDYQRVLYLDSDVMPLTNLDYMMEGSFNGDVLAPTVVVAGYLQPANGGFFVLTPNATHYAQLQELIQKTYSQHGSFDIVRGWGHAIQSPDLWETNRKRIRGTNWTFYAAHIDQGLLYHYPKYVLQNLTNIFSRKVVNYGVVSSSDNSPDNSTRIGVVREWKVTSVESSPFANVSRPAATNVLGSKQRMLPGNCNKVTGRTGLIQPDWPGCVPPYSDYHHFTGSDKPWLRKYPPENVWVYNFTAVSTDQWWWQLLKSLRDDDGIDISHMGMTVESPRGSSRHKFTTTNATTMADWNMHRVARHQEPRKRGKL